MPARKDPTDIKLRITASLSQDILRRLDEEADAQSKSRSELLEEVLDIYLRAKKKQAS